MEKNYKFPKAVSKQLKDLINLHLNPNPSTRLTMEDVLAHEWLQDGEAGENEE